jgi:hypothetical protein
MRTLDRSDGRAFARDDKILEAIRVSILRKEGVEKQQLIEIVRSRMCSSFASKRVFGSENEILSLVSTNFLSLWVNHRFSEHKSDQMYFSESSVLNTGRGRIDRREAVVCRVR